MTPSDKREIVNELRKDFINVLKAIGGFQRTVKRLMEEKAVCPVCLLPTARELKRSRTLGIVTNYNICDRCGHEFQTQEVVAEYVPGTMPDMMP